MTSTKGLRSCIGARQALLEVLDKSDQVPCRDECFCLIVRNRNTERVLKAHQQFHGVERIEAKVFPQPARGADVLGGQPADVCKLADHEGPGPH